MSKYKGAQDNVVMFKMQEVGVAKLKERGLTDVMAKNSRMAHSAHPDQFEYTPKWIKEKLGM